MSGGRPPCQHRALARALGRQTYQTGRTCGYGHDAPRLASNGHCVVCHRARSRWITVHGQRAAMLAGPERRRRARGPG